MKRAVLLPLLILLFLRFYGQYPNITVGTTNFPNEPSIAFDPANPEIVVAGANTDNFYYSSDGGYSWEHSILMSPWGVWGDPCIIVDTAGSFYFFHLSNTSGATWIDRIVCQRSDDGGMTWNDGTYMGLNGTKNQDKEWAVVDPETNAIYVTWTQFDSYGSNNPLDSTTILFSRSLDRGETWSTPVRLNKVAGDCIDEDNTVEGAVPAVGPEGQIYVSWAGPAGLVFTRSLDGGVTWPVENIFVSDIGGGWDYSIPGIYRANGLPVTVCDRSEGPFRGRIYINWSDQRNGPEDTDVFIVRSDDGGLTWSDPIRVNDDEPGRQQFFTWMTVDQATGYLYLVFYDRRDHADNTTDVFLAVSKDGGDTFDNIKINEDPFEPFSGIFFGDYTNIWAHNGIVRPIWTELSNFNLRLVTAIIDSLATGMTPRKEASRKNAVSTS